MNKMRLKTNWWLVAVALIAIIAISIGRAQQAPLFPTEPEIAPCPNDPNLYCRGSETEPKFLGTLHYIEGEHIQVCLQVFDCNYSEGLGWARVLTLEPLGGVMSDLTPVDCNTVVDVNGVAPCSAMGSCSHLYFDWPDTWGQAGQWQDLIEVVDNAGNKGYVSFNIIISPRDTTPPDFSLCVAGDD